MGATIHLISGATDIELPGPPGGFPLSTELHQIMGRSMDGTVHVYDHGVTVYPHRLALSNLSDAEKILLDLFFRITAAGMKNTWTYKDTAANSYTARFVRDALQFVKESQGRWAVTLDLEVSQLVG